MFATAVSIEKILRNSLALVKHTSMILKKFTATRKGNEFKKHILNSIMFHINHEHERNVHDCYNNRRILISRKSFSFLHRDHQ